MGFIFEQIQRIKEKYWDPVREYTKVYYKQPGVNMRFHVGIVTDNKDPGGLGRLKVQFPALGDNFVADWAPFVRPFAGEGAGMWFLPNVEDKVICAFINDNPQMPVVLGVLYNCNDKPPIKPDKQNDKKVWVTPAGTTLEFDDSLALGKISITSADGSMSLDVNHFFGISLSNSDGDIEIKCKKLIIKGDDDSELAFEKKLKIKAKKDISIKAKKNIKIVSEKKEVIFKGKKIKLDGSTGVTAKNMQMAAKDDQVIGLDIHEEMVPAGTSLVKVPFPNPFIGKLADKLSDDVLVKGKKAAVKGSKAKASPGHILIPPGVQFAKPPENEGEVSSGTEASVKINGKEAAVLLSGVKTCSDMTPPKEAVVITVGISLAAILAFAGLTSEKKKKKKDDGGGDQKKDKKKDDGSGDDKSTNASKTPEEQKVCKTDPVDMASGSVLTSEVDFKLPGPIPLEWKRSWFSSSSYKGPMGYGWHHSYDYTLFDEGEQIIFRLYDGRVVKFDPLQPGEESYNRKEKITLCRDEKGLYSIRTKEKLTYSFSPNPVWEVPGHLSSIEDLKGNRVLFTRNEDSGFLEYLLDSAGRIVFFENDKQGRITKITAPHPEKEGQYFVISSYKYDDKGDLVEAKDAMSQPWKYKYENHLMVQKTERNGFNFFYKYRSTGPSARCIRAWGDDGVLAYQFTYDDAAGKTISEDSLGHKTTFFWNESGLVTQVVDPLGGVSETDFNPFNEVVCETDELGNKRLYEYDERGNQVKVVNPDGGEVSMTYKDDLPVEFIDEMGAIRKWEYDEKGRLVNKSDSLNQETRYNYNEKFLKEYVDPAGGVTSFEVDKKGNLTGAVFPDGTRISWTYDTLGRCLSSTDPKGGRILREYDILGRITRVDETDRNIRKLSYDSEGNIIRAKDIHQDIRFEYTPINSLAARIEGGKRVEFLYDTEEQLIGIKNEHGLAYSFVLDPNGNIIEESGFDGIRKVFTRDAKGRLEKLERPNGAVSHYTFDPVDRLLELVHSDNSFEKYFYRKDGLLIEAQNSETAVKLEYDPLGRIIRERQGDEWVESVYNPLGMRVEMSSSPGAHQKIARNKMGDVEKVSHTNIKEEKDKSPWEVKYERDELGLEIQRSMPGGLWSRWERDRAGRPVTQTISNAKGFKRTRNYTWDVGDRLESIIDSVNGPVHYKHDTFGNLISAQYATGGTLFRMPDAVGNLYRTMNKKERKYGKGGELLESTGPEGIIRYEYDAEGNLSKKILPDGRQWQYRWNSSGMLAAVIRPDGMIVEFAYDPFGRRISKKTAGKITRWIWDGNLMLHEWVEHSGVNPDADSTAIKMDGAEIGIKEREALLSGREAHGPPMEGTRKEPISWIFEPETFTPIGKLVGEQKYSFVNDHLGVPIAVFNNQGEQIWAADLDIYGKVINLKGHKQECPFRFPGQYEDEETGLYYNRFRYYDPDMGQYVSQDPIGLNGGLNFYKYVKDSLVWLDPFGLKCTGSAKKGEYYEATVGSDGQLKLGKQLSKDEAVSKLRKQQRAGDHSPTGIYTKSRKDAKQIAQESQGTKAIRDRAHKDPITKSSKGRYKHFHDKDRKGGHVWYGDPEL